MSQGRELEGWLGQLCQEAAHKAWELPSGRGRMTTDGVTGWEGTREVQPGLEGRIPYPRALTD